MWMVIILVVLGLVAVMAASMAAPEWRQKAAEARAARVQQMRAASAGARTGGPEDATGRLLVRIGEIERAPQAGTSDDGRARALYEEGMTLAESSLGDPARLHLALDRFAASRAAKAGSGLCEAGFSEVLRQTARSIGAAPGDPILERALEYAQKATAQNSMEGESWAAYALSLVAAGAVADGEAVMNDHAAYQGYRMLRARAEAALARGDMVRAAYALESAISRCAAAEARAVIEARLRLVRPR